jgi:hypothetical protein
MHTGPSLTDRIAILADRAVTPLLPGKVNRESPRYLDAFSFAQSEVFDVQRQHPEWSDGGIVKFVRLRVASHLANNQVINVPRSENQERRRQGLDPLYMQQTHEPFLEEPSFVARAEAENLYSVCRDETDCNILDSLLAGRSIDKTATALGLPRDKTRGRIDGMKSYRDGYHSREQTADPAILLKARDEYKRDPHGYRLARLFHYCCCDLIDHHLLTSFFAGKDSGLPPQQVEKRLRSIAHRYVVM